MFVSIISSDLGSDLSPVKKGSFLNDMYIYVYIIIGIYIYKPIYLYICIHLSLSLSLQVILVSQKRQGPFFNSAAMLSMHDEDAIKNRLAQFADAPATRSNWQI